MALQEFDRNHQDIVDQESSSQAGILASLKNVYDNLNSPDPQTRHDARKTAAIYLSVIIGAPTAAVLSFMSRI